MTGVTGCPLRHGDFGCKLRELLGLGLATTSQNLVEATQKAHKKRTTTDVLVHQQVVR